MRANGSENCIGRVQPYLKSMYVKVSILSFQIRQIWEDEQFFLSKLLLKLQMYLLVEIITISNYLYKSVTTPSCIILIKLIYILNVCFISFSLILYQHMY